MTRLTQTIAIVVALVVAGAGSATAAKLITGKQIKDHSIAAKDLKKGVLTAGPTGPAGPAGAPGKDGAAGPAGKDGAPGANGTNGKDGADGAKGDTGPSAVFIHRKGEHTVSFSQDRTLATQTLAAGTYAVRADFSAIATNAGDQTCTLKNGATEVAASTWNASAGQRAHVVLVGKATVTTSKPLITCNFQSDKGVAQNIVIESTLAGAVTVTGESDD
jgi:collagen triple helix repeat protein